MYIHVKVKTNTKKEVLEKIDDSHFAVSVREKAERNEANARIIEVLRNHFGTRSVRIINGHYSPSKLFSIDLDDVI